MDTSSDDDKLTPEEFPPEDAISWLRMEISHLSKAMELRLTEATDFVTAYASGQITIRELIDRMNVYTRRWGDTPVPGVHLHDGMANEEIIAARDKVIEEELRETSWGRHLARTGRSWKSPTK